MEYFRNSLPMDSHVQCLDVGRNPDGQTSTESLSYVGTTVSRTETGKSEGRADRFSSVARWSARWHGKGFSEEESNPPARPCRYPASGSRLPSFEVSAFGGPNRDDRTAITEL